MILGWLVDTRRFTVALPEDKYHAWTKVIDKILANRHAHVTTNDLEKTLGRLSHAAYVVPYSRHFMGRLYKACERSKRSGKTRLTNPQRDDLSLWRSFLRRAAQGISINRLVCRWPTRIVRVDACPQGIGGYGLQSGIAWRYQLPEDLAGRATLNTLEFLAAFVGMVVEFREGKKSSFDDNCPLHLTIARSFADFCLTHEIDHYTQWFPGRENKVADILSRDFALDDDEVTSLIRKHGSPFVPQNFRIIPLQPALISQIGDWLRLLPKTQLLPTQPAPSAAAAGTATHDSSSESESTSTLFSAGSDETKGRKSSRVSLPPFGTDGFASRQPATDGNGAMSGTIRATLDGVAQTFRLNKLESPIHDSAGRLDPLLALQLKKYADDDPGVAQQQAIPLEVIRKVRSWSRNELDVAVGQLVVTAFFFAMRSCEYSDVGGGRRTSVVRVDDVRFRKQDETLTTFSYEQTRNADAVTITYRQQKNGDKGAKVTQHRNNNPGQADICPVRTLAELIHRIRGYERLGRTNPKINAFVSTTSNELEHVSSKTILEQLRAATILSGERGWDSRPIESVRTRLGRARPWQCTWQVCQAKRYRWWAVGGAGRS
ncbi:hypothetical protein MHU86_16539 [Fragilaria crotonensis]|nr:hypothetical protein MHU86_16539 [Fragilaria crotonensis]